MYKSIHPSTDLSHSHPLIHPPSQAAIASHLLFSQLFPLLLTLPLFLPLSSILSLSLTRSLAYLLSLSPKAHPWYERPAPVSSELFPRHPDGERQPWQKSLCKQFISFSALDPPHSHDNQSGRHGEKLPRKISIWHTDWKHSSRTCYATVTLVSLRCRREGIVGQKRPVRWLKRQIKSALFHCPFKLALFSQETPPKLRFGKPALQYDTI